MLLATLLLCAPAEVPRNLVVVVTDDQARWAVGAYGNDEVRTPSIDRLADEGARFDNAFVPAPVCSPSRASWLTGRYPTELTITDWISPEEAARGLGLAAPTWTQALQASGLRTALVGKWHLGSAPDHHPTRLGFDEFVGFLGGGARPMDATLERDGEARVYEGPLPDRLTDEALRFIEENAAGRFALCLHFRAPHRPYGPVPEEDRAPYAELEPTLPDFPGLDADSLAETTRAYYASISSIDRNVGRLLDALERLELESDTVVVFTSDHGYNEGRHGIDTKGNGHWIVGGHRGPKRPNMWDTSLAIPLIVRWPGVVQPGTRIPALASGLDFYRTVLGLFEVPIPEGASPHGRDLGPLLRGGTLEPRDALFGQYDLHNNGLAHLRMIRTERWKLVTNANGLDELYDLESDPGERTNLHHRVSREEPDLVRGLEQRLHAWMHSIGDPLLAAGDGPRAERPNVLFMLSDDQRPDAVRAFGHADLETPNLDAFAAAGTAFRRTYCMGAQQGAVCLPSRGMLLGGRSLYRYREAPVLLPEHFRAGGYQTFGTGKWHNGREWFQRSFEDGEAIFFGGMGSHTELLVNAFDESGEYPKEAREPIADFSSTTFVDAAIRFLDRRDRARPFFCWVSFTAPHDPRTPPAEDLARYRPEELELPENFLPVHPFDNGEMLVRDEKLEAWPRTPAAVRRHLAEYYGMITQLDRQVGRMIEALRERDLLDSTVVVFASDHGLAVGSHGLLGKQNLYEHSMGAVMMLRGPGVPEGESRRALTYLHDLYPTLCELTGLEIPAHAEGASLVPLLERDPRTPWRETLFTTYRRDQKAVTDGRFKLIRYPRIDVTQLFDLESDPAETKNLAANPAHAERLGALRAELGRWQTEVGDDTPWRTAEQRERTFTPPE